ncbi:upf0481 protein at3g47200 [Phtheirospermum japonicum]|uniref:Upf0481 protein at3g47200 n=1 Tax=Phtheirospermum japonicum TaxID=374723 RepID=A0A830CJ58_9LAMI|nr:upf0481 protein at3g47200 [Phtheirospermum japonicum]
MDDAPENIDECNEENQQALTPQEFSQLLQSQPRRKWQPGSDPRRQIHKVPPQIRVWVGPRSERLYDPNLVSLGPYHHGKPELRRAEEFKYLCLDSCTGGDEERKTLLYNKVVEKINEIRECYAEVEIVEKYDDKALALMMLLDGCFVIKFMQNVISQDKTDSLDWLHYLGKAASTAFATHDILLLENQIPFQVLKLLIISLPDKETHEDLFQLYLTRIVTKDLNQAKIPRENEDPPIHFLEACWRVSVEKHFSEQNPHQTSEKEETNYFSYTSSRPIMDLKAKGIRFRPRRSCSFMDIAFESHAFYGELYLPVRYISDLTNAFLANMIAYEVSPKNKTKPAVLSYTIFMKSLIQSPEDVRELVERGIILNTFGNYEQVVRVFKEADTFGCRDVLVFEDIRRRIDEHCRSRANTWMADLVHTRFRSPWTAIALFAAAFLLCLTFLQAFFTIRPVK